MAESIYSLANAYGMQTEPNLAPPGHPEAHSGPAPEAAPSDRAAELLAMLKRAPAQSDAPSVYAPQLADALSRNKANEDAFNQMIAAAMQRKEDAGPSKAEMYFRLAAAFGTPTKTGFMENVGLAGAAAADIEKQRREAGAGERDKLLQLGMMKHKMAMEGSKDEVNTLRALTGEEMKDRRALANSDAADKRAIALKQYEALLASGKPQSEAGKYAADQGFKPGTPEFAQAAEKYFKTKLDNGDYFKQMGVLIQQGNQSIAAQGLALRQDAATAQAAERAKLTPQEFKIKNETETALNTLRDSYSDLMKVKALNPNTYDTSIPDMLEYKVKSAAGSTDPRVVNTGELSNLLRQGALSTAATTLKTQISDSDIKMLQGLQGLDSKSKEERGRIVENARQRLLAAYKLKKAQLAEINAGRARIATPQAAFPDTLE